MNVPQKRILGIHKMLTDLETYKLVEGSWKEFQDRMEAIPDPKEPGAKGSDLNRNILLEDKYMCKVSLYNSQEKVDVFYIGLQKKQGREKLENELGLKLESIVE